MKEWGLKFLRKLKPAMWRYKAPFNDGREHFGFIAQDVDKVASRRDYGFVGFKDHGLTLNYEEFVGPITAGVLELDETVTSSIPQLFSMIEDLEKRIKKLEEQKENEISTNSN